MPNIIHRVGIKGSIEQVYNALTTDEGLSSWWTSTTEGAGEAGSTIHFKFNDVTVLFDILDLRENQYVKWHHAGNMPEDWNGTEVVFELERKNNQTYVGFSHRNWKEPSNFMSHCSTKWAVFLLSLKDAIETGKGRPFPDDIHIDHDE